MIIVLRIDDRLIHAQVVIGWGRSVKPDRIVIADDEVAANDWEKQLYASASSDFRVSILSVAKAYEQIDGGVFDKEKIILLVRGPRSAIRLLEMGLESAGLYRHPRTHHRRPLPEPGGCGAAGGATGSLRRPAVVVPNAPSPARLDGSTCCCLRPRSRCSSSSRSVRAPW